MVNRAVIVKDEYVVYASSNKLVPDNDEFIYSAAFMLSPHKLWIKSRPFN